MALEITLIRETAKTRREIRMTITRAKAEAALARAEFKQLSAALLDQVAAHLQAALEAYGDGNDQEQLPDFEETCRRDRDFERRFLDALRACSDCG